MKTPSDRINTIERDLGTLMIKALSLKLQLSKGEFREEDHPRADDGKFGDKAGSHEGGESGEGGGDIKNYSIPIQTSEQSIKSIISDESYEKYGLRVITENPKGDTEILKIGDTPPNSYTWDDGESTDVELEGTSSIEINPDNIPAALQHIGPYSGDKVVLLGADSYSYGDDDNELILSDAKVLGTFHKDALWGTFRGDKMPPPKKASE
jgi:hypothetical protein